MRGYQRLWIGPSHAQIIVFVNQFGSLQLDISRPSFLMVPAAKDPNAARADAMLLGLKDSHWLNRKYAAEVLGELKETRAVRPLVDALADEVGDVRQRAYDSLIKIGGPAVSSLVPLLVSEEDELRQSVTEIIRKIGKPAVEPLATALAEADDRLKTRVMKVLDRMGYKPKIKDDAKAVEAPRLT